MYEGGSQGGMYPTPPQPYQVAQPVTSAPSSAGGGSGGGGGGGYPRLQLAQPVQQRPGPPPSPSVQGVEAGPGGSPLTSSKVPIDKVIEDVSAMGFTREQVRSVVRKLTENGQAVDLNVVLDKLMNGGGAGDQKKWFGR